MTADDDVDPGDLTGQDLILGAGFHGMGPDMGKQKDQIDLFPVPQKVHDGAAALRDIGEDDRHGVGAILRGVVPHQTEQADPEAVSLQDGVFQDREFPEGGF